MNSKTINVPDIGDFDAIPVIEVLVNVGDEVAIDDSLVTLESDKATMEIPATVAGKIDNLHIKVGDTVSTGDVVATLHVTEQLAEETSASEVPVSEVPESPSGSTDSTTDTETSDQHSYDCDLLVLGAGPGGYAAAFRAADLGLNVVLVERESSLGGVCLNVGCIPSKALLHAAKVIDDAAKMKTHGIQFGQPVINVDQLRDWKQSVVDKLTGGLTGLAKQRKVRVIQGVGKFVDSHQLKITNADDVQTLSFASAIIAAGSEPVHLPGLPWDDERLIDSTGALELTDIPNKLLVIGGGIIGLEMACVYNSLGSQVTVVELLDQLMPGADKDLVRPLQKHIKAQGQQIYTEVKVESIGATPEGLKTTFSGKKPPEENLYDRVLVAVGRSPNGAKLDADKAGVGVDQRGFINVDSQMRTNVKHIFAIGDLVGQPMLAHKATHEGKVAAEVIAGEPVHFDASVIPSVAYTDPEVAWAGVTENQAAAENTAISVSKFPWAASGRSLGMGRSEGVTKLIFSKDSGRLIGAGVVGPHAGDLIAEAALAIEMGCNAEDIGHTIHPHPTLSETIGMAAEAELGSLTDLYIPRKK